ncbi:MAG TPA: hypothetical protein VE131_12950 [Terriglobales bacterium]|nr:hypothetical protein [Terriglobales bacterium]
MVIGYNFETARWDAFAPRPAAFAATTEAGNYLPDHGPMVKVLRIDKDFLGGFNFFT